MRMTMQDAQPPATSRPLPVLALAGESLQLLLRQPVAFLAALAVPLLIELLSVWAFWSTYGPEMVRFTASGGADFGQPGLFMLRMFGLLLVLLIAYSLFAVAWHRFALLGPGQAPGLVPAVHGRHVRFLLVTYGVSLLIGLLAFALVFLLQAARVQSQIVFVLIGLALALIFVRWQLAFPAIAIDRPLGLGGAWRASRGQTLRLFWLFLLMVVPPAALRWVVDGMFEQDLGLFIVTGEITPRAGIGLAISAVIGYAMLALLVGAVSGAYRTLVLEQQRGQGWGA